MPTLDWIGKSAVVNHHREVPTRLLHCDSDLSFGDPDAGNLLVQGDNLEALKALLPYFAGKVKCIYIDPPYNTGNEGWIYNDNVNSPEIKSWLGSVVGRESEDLSRHDKWLCMMFPRVSLLKEFLRKDGFIFISIDSNELHHAKMLFDLIFGSQLHRNTISVRRGIKSVQAQFKDIDKLSQGHEYILLYSNSKDARLNKLSIAHDINSPGKWDTFWRGTDRPTMRYELFGKIPESGQWRWEEDRTKRAIKNYKYYIDNVSQELSLDEWYIDNISSTNKKLDFVRKGDSGAAQYYVPPRGGKLSSDNWMDILLSGSVTKFETEKNVKLINRIVEWITGPDDIILDAFSGSATTGQSVIEVNRRDNGNRKFILIEMVQLVATTIAIPRLKEIIQPHLAEGVRFCTLGETVFDQWGGVNEGVVFGDLAAFVFFSDTGSPIPAKASGETSLLGDFQGRAIHLLFAPGSIGVADAAAGNVLTLGVLEALPAHDGPRVVYAEGCTVPPERLAADGVVFKQVPYQLQAT